MKGILVACAFAALLSGCKTWPAKNFERVTGIPLQKGNSLCLNIASKGASECRPNVGGLPWQKVQSVQPLVLPAASADDIQARLIGSMYLGHRYARGSVLVNCPTINPFVGDEAMTYARYFQIESSRMSLASALNRTVIQQAKLDLAAAAKAKGHPSISAEGMAEFERALSGTISATSAQSTDVIYVQGYMLSGLQEVIELPPYATCLEGMDEQHESIVTGIAGFYLADFSATSKLVDERLMTTAIEATAAASPSDSAILQDVKVEAAGSWSMTVNTRLEQQTIGKRFGNTFFPIYIRFERKHWE